MKYALVNNGNHDWTFKIGLQYFLRKREKD